MGKEKETAAITAQAAKEIADSTHAVKNHCYKFIREAAKEGRVQVAYNIQDISTAQSNALKTELVNLGYEVTHYENDNSILIIKW